MKFQSPERIENRQNRRSTVILGQTDGFFDSLLSVSFFDNEPVNFEPATVTSLPVELSHSDTVDSLGLEFTCPLGIAASPFSVKCRYTPQFLEAARRAFRPAQCGSVIFSRIGDANGVWRTKAKKARQFLSGGTVDALFVNTMGHEDRRMGAGSQLDWEVASRSVAVDLPPGRVADGEDRSGRSSITIMNNFRSSNL